MAQGKLSNLDRRVSRIEERNLVVEADKAWETSWARRLLLTAFTYLAISIYLRLVGLPHPLANAIVPSVAFMLSTLTLPYFKRLWLKARARSC
jgi:hypothetical protein